jgi:transposase
VGGREQQVHFAVNTLGYSRRFYFVVMRRASPEQTISASATPR